MASSQSTEASEIRRRGRQRLIGAVAIALLLIVFVPMLLDSEPRSAAKQEPKLEIPPRDSVPPLPAPRSGPGQSANDSKSAADGRPALPGSSVSPGSPGSSASPGSPAAALPGATPPGGVAPGSVPPGAAQPGTAAPGTSPPVAVVEKATTASPNVPKSKAKMEGFAIQVGAFRDEAKLKQARDTLAAAKISSYTEPAGDLTRLRVGPFPTREAAEKTAATVRKSVPDAKVVPLP